MTDYHPAPDPITLDVDPLRVGHVTDTGIYVRAKSGEVFDAFDIAELTRESLQAWLRSRGGANVWAEEVVFALLNYPTTKPIRGYKPSI